MAKQSPRLVLVTENPYNAETPLSALLEKVTPLNLVYVRNHFAVPQIDEAGWSLAVDGAVKRPLSISYAGIKVCPPKPCGSHWSAPATAGKACSPCPTGTPWGYGAVSSVEFTGTPLANVLQQAGIPESVIEVGFQGADRGEVEPGRIEGFVRSLPLAVALNSDTLLAWEMNGQPLTADHGFPMRLVVPGWYAMASVKWLSQVTLLTQPRRSFFQHEHYVYVEEEGLPDGEPVRHIRPRSLIVSPAQESVLGRR